ncbi:Protein arginine n-methyltransferase [Musa troglodytarum]|uniref:Protein arginine n-methyltransferase n=1 Tax=Musa troglodytarum TaxID=320322 RepID=A0A9E7HD98_9LILI|nr:Protein arginine n-methyltransferase [Musa troglodytarum]
MAYLAKHYMALHFGLMLSSMDLQIILPITIYNLRWSKKRIKSDEGIVLSTAPEDAPTHWQQTLLYLYDPIELQQDQKIEGSVTLSQSKENAVLKYSSGILGQHDSIEHLYYDKDIHVENLVGVVIRFMSSART